jgi:hypothetical protein
MANSFLLVIKISYLEGRMNCEEKYKYVQKGFKRASQKYEHFYSQSSRTKETLVGDPI